MAKRAVCCSSPAAMCYWLAASVVAWGLLSLVGRYWQPLGPASASTIVLAAGLGCVANWVRHRTFHCAITAPLLLIAGTVFLLADLGLIHAPERVVWALLGAGVCIAFLLEAKYAPRT